MRFRVKPVIFALIVIFSYTALRVVLFDGSHSRPEFTRSSDSSKKIEQPQNNYILKNVVELPSSNQTILANTSRFKVLDPNAVQQHCDKINIKSPQLLQKQTASLFKDVTCVNLLHSDSVDIYKKAKDFMGLNPFKKTADQDFIDIAANCEKYKSERGFHLNPVTQNEAEFPIAYNILTHKDVHQIEFLLRAIYRPQNVYCLHIDAKQPATFQNGIRAIVSCFDNVYVASKLESIVYAGFTRLQADINCMKDQVKHPMPWRYLINIAGQSFPLKSNDEIVNILRIYNGANDIEGIYGARIIHTRFKKQWLEKNGRMVVTNITNPQPPNNIEIVRGSAYGIFSRKFVEYIVTDERAKALLEWSRFTYSPDEHYWATLHHTYGNPHLNTPGAFAGKPDSKPWMAVWVAWGGVDKCHGISRRGTCVFGVGDLPQLLPHNELFANKFYIDNEYLTLQCLNEWLEFKVTCPQLYLDYDYYRGLPYIYKQTGS